MRIINMIILKMSKIETLYYNSSKGQGKGGAAMIDYSPLWETMERKGVTQYRLLKDNVLDTSTLHGIKRRNSNITLLTLERICKYLQCTPNDVIKFVDDEEGRS